ncbi:MAG: hypothetical protein Q7S64_02505 [bacterium]|nr:hypothetical protein [bacterium]
MRRDEVAHRKAKPIAVADIVDANKQHCTPMQQARQETAPPTIVFQSDGEVMGGVTVAIAEIDEMWREISHGHLWTVRETALLYDWYELGNQWLQPLSSFLIPLVDSRYRGVELLSSRRTD